MDTRLLALRMVPGFDDQILRHMINAGAESDSLKALVIQLYGTGNAPSVKKELIQCLTEASELGILVVATTQCHRGTVMMGKSRDFFEESFAHTQTDNSINFCWNFYLQVTMQQEKL